MNEQEREHEAEAARIFFQGMNAAMNGQTASSAGPHSERAFEMAREYDWQVLGVDVALLGRTITFRPSAASLE
jgi:hypothetical protein